MVRTWLFLIIASLLLCLPAVVLAEVEIQDLKAITFESPPLDSATSEDGNYLFVLTPGNVNVYSLPDGIRLDVIPVDEGYTRIMAVTRGNLLVLGGEAKEARIFRLDFIVKFDNAGSPVKGLRDARVEITVFNDFQ